MKEWDCFLIKSYSSLPNNRISDFELMEASLKARHVEAYYYRMVTLMEQNQMAYVRYQQCMQILDAAVLDYRINRFSPTNLVAGLVYFMIKKFFLQSNYCLFYWTGDLNSAVPDLFVDYEEVCSCIVFKFLAENLGINSLEMVEVIQNFLQEFTGCFCPVNEPDVRMINVKII